MAYFEINDNKTELHLNHKEAIEVCSLLMAQLADTNVPNHHNGACPQIPLYLLGKRMAFISSNKKNEFFEIENGNTIFCVMNPCTTATLIAGVLRIFTKSYQDFTLPEPFIQGDRNVTLTVTIPKAI